MSICRWCGVDLAGVPSRTWGGQEECASAEACNTRQAQREAQAAIEAGERRALRRQLQDALERRGD